MLGALSLLGVAWKVIRGLGGAIMPGGAILTAVISAVPPMLEAIVKFFDAVGKSPLLAFLFGASLLGPVGVVYGMKWDAPARAAIEKRAIAAANARADVAIARNKAAFDERLAAYEKRIAELQKSAKGKR